MLCVRGMCRLIATIAIAVPSSALAHITLTSPPPRTTVMRTSPCGDTTVRGSPLTLEPGHSLVVTWDTPVAHPSYFRLSFDPDGQDFSVPPDTTTDTRMTDPNVLIDHITPATNQYEVTLPNVECSNCTLQLIQVITDGPVYDPARDLHFQCADIALVRPIVVDGPPDAGAQPGGGGSEEPPPGEGTPRSRTNPYVSRGCTASPGSGGLIALLAFGLGRQRRRAS